MSNTDMNHLDIYSPDYTLKCLVAEGYLHQGELDEIIQAGATKEQVVEAVKELLLAD